MAFPQNVNFRSTLGFVTDAANTSMENNNNNSGAVNYPTVGSQGGNIGWETFTGGNAQVRNRNAANDARIAGCHLTQSATAVITYRIDLPAAGTYPISLAAGDPDYARQTNVVLKDTTTSLGTLASGATSGSQRFKDATNTEYTNVTWPGSNTAANKVFATTIARFEVGDGANGGSICHIGIGAAIATGPDIDSVDDMTPEEGSTLVVTGTALKASGNSTATIGGVSQAITTQSATVPELTVALGTLKFGTTYNLVITDSDAAPSNSFALTSLQPAAGNGFVNVGTPNADSSIRLTSVAAAASGDQVEWENSALVTIYSDLTWNADASVTTIRARIWTAGDGYGPWTEQTINQTAGGAGTTGRRRMQLKLGF